MTHIKNYIQMSPKMTKDQVQKMETKQNKQKM